MTCRNEKNCCTTANVRDVIIRQLSYRHAPCDVTFDPFPWNVGSSADDSLRHERRANHERRRKQTNKGFLVTNVEIAISNHVNERFAPFSFERVVYHTTLNLIFPFMSRFERG